MPKEYTKEQSWEIFKKMPEELREAVMSEKTAEAVFDACIDNGVDDERISEVARFAGRVLMGLIPPEEFQDILKEELKIKEETAKKISREINRFVFYPVKPLLEEINKTEAQKEKPGKIEKEPEKTEKEEPKTSSASDSYREPVE